MTVPISGTSQEAPGQCTSCTVPTDRPDGLCSFCADPPPPLDAAEAALYPAHPIADALIRCANYAELARLDVDKLIADLPADVPLWATVDLVAARAHLTAAVKKLDTAATRIADAEVAR